MHRTLRANKLTAWASPHASAVNTRSSSEPVSHFHQPYIEMFLQDGRWIRADPHPQAAGHWNGQASLRWYPRPLSRSPLPKLRENTTKRPPRVANVKSGWPVKWKPVPTTSRSRRPPIWRKPYSAGGRSSQRKRSIGLGPRPWRRRVPSGVKRAVLRNRRGRNRGARNRSPDFFKTR
jgi:hypothetical protein